MFFASVNAFTPCRLSVEHVLQNWMKDSLFGSQFLNGVNPMVIRCCKELPENLPVTDDMVHLRGGRSLKEEMQVCVSPECRSSMGSTWFKGACALPQLTAKEDQKFANANSTKKIKKTPLARRCLLGCACTFTECNFSSRLVFGYTLHYSVLLQYHYQ